MVHAIVLPLFLLVLMPLAKLIPMPIIAAILFMVAYNMSEWRHFVHIVKTAPLADILVLVLTFVLTVALDLVVAISVGLVLSAILFMKRMSDETGIRRWDENDSNGERAKSIPKDTLVYEFSGPMFFAGADKLLAFSLEENTRSLILRMGNVQSVDATTMKNLEFMLESCKKYGIRLMLSHVNSFPMKVLTKAGFIDKLGSENIFDDIDSALEAAKATYNQSIAE